MGFGDSPVGSGLAGFDDAPAIERISPTKPKAILFDPSNRSFPMLDDGQFASIHPVDQAVGIILGVFQTSLRPTVTTGLDRQRIRHAPRAALANTIADEVKRALSDLIIAGDIDLIGTPLASNANGRPLFFVDYRNLRLNSNDSNRVPVTA